MTRPEAPVSPPNGRLERKIAETSWILEAEPAADVFTPEPDTPWSTVNRRKGGAFDWPAGATYALRVSEAPPTLLSPLLSVVPGKPSPCCGRAQERLAPDQPVGLGKVTLLR